MASLPGTHRCGMESRLAPGSVIEANELELIGFSEDMSQGFSRKPVTEREVVRIFGVRTLAVVNCCSLTYAWVLSPCSLSRKVRLILKSKSCSQSTWISAEEI